LIHAALYNKLCTGYKGFTVVKAIKNRYNHEKAKKHLGTVTHCVSEYLCTMRVSF